MNNYKVGDRVWYDGEKHIISEISCNARARLYGYRFLFIGLGNLKPILKVKNGVICE